MEDTSSRQTRDRILHTAAELFGQQGYSGVSMRRIADACEMKAGSLYYHFGSKDEILSEVLNLGTSKVMVAVLQALDELPDTAPAPEKLRAALTGHLRALLEYSVFTSANVRIFGQVPEVVRQANLDARRAYETLWDELLAGFHAGGALRADVDPRSLRLMVIGALNATLEWFDPARGDVDGLAARYADVLSHGVFRREGE